jgi:hypothetical protein
MADLIDSMITNYNEAIKICKKDPLGSAASNETVCGIQKIIKQNVSDRLRVRESSTRRDDDDDDDNPHMFQTMCGCRLTARVMFVMIILGISELKGSFFDTYSDLFDSEPSNIVNTIMGRGLNKTEIESIMRGQVPNVALSLTPSSDLFIVQILKYIEWWGGYSPVHSFIIKNLGNGNCQVLSSWFAGGDTLATPIISNTLSCEELNERLKPENLLNDENTNFLFGQGNNLNGNLVTIFISKDAIVPPSEGGRKNKTKKNKRKIKKRKTK